MAKNFQLPRNWYPDTIADLFEHELLGKFGPLTAANAWKYLIASVMWAEPSDDGYGPYLHLNDRLSTIAGRDLAKRGEDYLDEHFAPDGNTLAHIDAIGKRYSNERVAQGKKPGGWQRNNVTGRSFESTLQELIDRICGVRPAREPQLHTLHGFELAPVAYHSQPDLALFSPSDFRLLISTKWSLRKERIGTYLHEAYFYRRRRADLQVAFVVAEFNPNIIEWLVNDPLVDRVYHLHLPMLLAVHEPFRGQDTVTRRTLVEATQERKRYERWAGLGSRLFDLSQLFEDVERLKPDAPPPPEPDGEEPDDGDEDLGL